MADNTASFEQKMARLESIVRELENGSVDLDRAVALFKEGKTLADECENQLKAAQKEIDRTMEPQPTPAASDDDIPF